MWLYITQDVDNQTRRMCLKAVNENGMVLQFVKTNK